MKKQTTLIITIAMATFIGLASIAAAGHGKQGGYANCPGAQSNADEWGGCMGYHGGQVPNLPQEKQEAYQKIIKEFEARMNPLQEKIWEKHMELEALAPNPNTQTSELKSLVKEIKDLHSQLRDEHQELNNKLEKEIGLKREMRGFHHYHKGYGRGNCQGYTHNGPRMGHGSGPGYNNE